jgi:UDP-3-O-[3-hydroxymyristoyl] N-acetylglucosamine deacetylase
MSAVVTIQSKKATGPQIDLSLSPFRQKTVAGPVAFQGTALHLGGASRIDVQPAGEDYGIRFSHASDDIISPLVANYFGDYTTSVNHRGHRILTVEHLLSAMYALGITNAHIRLYDQYELPILDGSSLPFMQGLMQVGVVSQEAPARCLKIKDTIYVHDKDSDSIIIAAPCDSFIVDAQITFAESIIGTQQIRTAVTANHYLRDIAPARTFLKESLDVVPLSAVSRDRLRGLNYDDPHLSPVILYSNERFLTSLRFDDEPVRHKVLDFIGDVSTLGMVIMGEFYLYRPGHRANLKLCDYLLDQVRLLEY